MKGSKREFFNEILFFFFFLMSSQRPSLWGNVSGRYKGRFLEPGLPLPAKSSFRCAWLLPSFLFWIICSLLPLPASSLLPSSCNGNKPQSTLPILPTALCMWFPLATASFTSYHSLEKNCPNCCVVAVLQQQEL